MAFYERRHEARTKGDMHDPEEFFNRVESQFPTA